MNGHLDGLLGLWTTSEIAKAMNVSATEVSRWRHGYRRPQPRRIREMGDALAALRCSPARADNADIAKARQEIAEAVAADAAARRPDHAR